MADKDNNLPTTWTLITFKDAVENIPTNNKKIKQKDYLTLGKFPIVDQGQSLIGGYTDDESKVIFSKRPLLIFGDHTKILKYISQNFAPGAEGVKVLASQKFFEPKLFLYFTQHLVSNLVDNGYARHYQHLEKCFIPIPPLNEQKRIVAKIEELFSEIDNGLKNLQRTQEVLKVYRQSLLKIAFDSKLTEKWRQKNRIKEWNREKLEKLTCKVGSGATPKGGKNSYHKEGIPFIRSMNIHFSGFDLSGLVFIDQSQAQSLNNVIVKEGDVLLNITGASIGRVTKAPANMDSARVNQHVCIIRCLPHVLESQFLNLYLSSPEIQYKIVMENYGVTRPALTKKQILDLTIPLPTMEEQRLIVDEVSRKLQEIISLECAYTKQFLFSKQLRQSILKKAFAGELVPQDPNDEPANVLLERIKSEQLNHSNSQTKSKKKQKVSI